MNISKSGRLSAKSTGALFCVATVIHSIFIVNSAWDFGTIVDNMICIWTPSGVRSRISD